VEVELEAAASIAETGIVQQKPTRAVWGAINHYLKLVRSNPQ
jgi:hypothetical protein